MSNSLQSYSYFASLIDSNKLEEGSLETPISITLDGDPYKFGATIANAANTIMYADQLGTFNFLYIACDFDLRILITDNASASFSLGLRGTGISGRFGIALQLGLDETSNTNTTINAVQAFNTSGSTARCLIVVAK